MLFNSVTFILFHFIVLIAYWSAPRQGLRRVFLSIGSILFYGWYYWLGLFIMTVSILFNYFIGGQVAKRQSKQWLTFAVAVNLLGLSYFKYSQFLVEAFIDITRVFGIEVQVPLPPVWLPLGISFFTFQIIAYLVDIYREKTEAEQDFFTLYVSYVFMVSWLRGRLFGVMNSYRS